MLKFEERDTNSRETCFTLGYLLIHFMENRPSIRFLRAFDQPLIFIHTVLLKINWTQILLSKKYFIEITRWWYRLTLLWTTLGNSTNQAVTQNTTSWIEIWNYENTRCYCMLVVIMVRTTNKQTNKLLWSIEWTNQADERGKKKTHPIFVVFALIK